MGKYVNPPEEAERLGRRISLRRNLSETASQLLDGESVCAVARRVHGICALVVSTDRDHDAVEKDQNSLVGVFAIPNSLVPD